MLRVDRQARGNKGAEDGRIAYVALKIDAADEKVALSSLIDNNFLCNRRRGA
jgi:hypothetical protein